MAMKTKVLKQDSLEVATDEFDFTVAFLGSHGAKVEHDPHPKFT